MIRVSYENIGERYFISLSGHANSAPKGQDLVCCAASTLFQSFMYYVEDIEDENKCSIQMLECKEGHLLIIVDGNRNYIKPAFDMMTKGIDELIKAYPKNISLLN